MKKYLVFVVSGVALGSAVHLYLSASTLTDVMMALFYFLVTLIVLLLVVYKRKR